MTVNGRGTAYCIVACKERAMNNVFSLPPLPLSLAHARSRNTVWFTRLASAMARPVMLCVTVCWFGLAASAHGLSASYPFRATLNTEERGGLYELYWRFDNEAETIDFAVRVQTTGWIGFGLSPNGQMPNSDVVIGWVENNEAFLQVSMPE